MVLYDQDFKFIGMSAETLTFLGYENIDEFTSMHTDFADLFIKKEGFIHKFENFSWIHYILYSGAANKKAYISRKNGSEICVDITIKEVFLNHAYDGLRMIYSVKLINENFTQISQSDVHDKRSAKKSEFSLNSLTRDLDIPAPEKMQPEIETPEPVTTEVPEPLDFKLDLPENSSPETVNEEFSGTKPDFPDLATTPAEEPADMTFKLDLPETITQEKEEESAVHIDFDLPQNTQSTSETPTDISEENMFKLNFPAAEETESQNHIDFGTPVKEESTLLQIAEEEERSEKTVENTPPPLFKTDVEEKKPADQTPPADIFSFKLLKEEEESVEEKQPEPAETVTHESVSENEASSETLAETETAPKSGGIFNFSFLKKEEVSENRAVETEKEDKETTPLMTEEEQAPSIPEKHESETEEKSVPENPPAMFSFDLFKEEPAEETPVHSIPDSETKTLLIDQIKSDIEEIDKEVPLNNSEKDEASQKLEALLRQSMDEQQNEETEQLQESKPEDFKIRIQKEEKEEIAFSPLQEEISGETEPETKEERVEKEVSVKPAPAENMHLHEENSFEETLKNIFSIQAEKNDEEENFLRTVEEENDSEETKQDVTEEYIESRNQIEADSPETLEMPELGNLGLSKEEELDFIEEFLDDTIATVGLMQEYLQLEDYNNIRYNLIKISSSAEILRFGQMLTYTRELAQLSDAHQKDAAIKKLQALLHLTKRYKEHFSTMPV